MGNLIFKIESSQAVQRRSSVPWRKTYKFFSLYLISINKILITQLYRSILLKSNTSIHLKTILDFKR